LPKHTHANPEARTRTHPKRNAQVKQAGLNDFHRPPTPADSKTAPVPARCCYIKPTLNTKCGSETVTPMLDKDGKWKVVGYLIR
jgi:hypothetical protein